MGDDEKRQAAEPTDDLVQDTPPASAEDSAAPASEAADEKAPPSLEDRIQELAAALAKAEDRSLRQLAETENIRRRFERERAESLKYAASGLARNSRMNTRLRLISRLPYSISSTPVSSFPGDRFAVMRIIT